MRRLFTTAVAVSCSIAPVVASGQPSPPPVPVPPPAQTGIPDGALGLELSVIEPRGDFRPGSSLSIGYGVRGALQWGPRHAFDVGLVFRSIAHDSRTYSDTVEVKNMIRTLALSTRYTAPLKYLRPYVGASVGANYFGTETNIESCCDENGDRQWTLDNVRLGRLTPMASMRVGLVVDLWRMLGPNPSTLAADLGLETHHGGRVTYQVGGRGPVRRSGTSYRVYSLGVSLRTR
jgi:hypothetical protein